MAFFTGLEISCLSIKMTQLVREKRSWKMINCATIPLPSGVFEPSYSSKNIVNFPLFVNTVSQMLKVTEGRINRIGLSLPNEVIKVSIHEFEDLPESGTGIEQLVG